LADKLTFCAWRAKGRWRSNRVQKRDTDWSASVSLAK